MRTAVSARETKKSTKTAVQAWASCSACKSAKRMLVTMLAPTMAVRLRKVRLSVPGCEACELGFGEEMEVLGRFVAAQAGEGEGGEVAQQRAEPVEAMVKAGSRKPRKQSSSKRGARGMPKTVTSQTSERGAEEVVHGDDFGHGDEAGDRLHGEAEDEAEGIEANGDAQRPRGPFQCMPRRKPRLPEEREGEDAEAERGEIGDGHRRRSGAWAA